jgi:ribosomal protein S18 acetylase RimI-like enzyme
MEDRVRRLGCERLRLEVRADNPRARRLYETAGFRRFAIAEDYYEDGETAWRYEKALV